MAFRPERASTLAVGLAARAVVLSLLFLALIQLLRAGSYPATSLLVVIVAALLIADLVRRSVRAIEANEPAGASPDVIGRQRREERTQALIDTVTAALIVLHEDGRVVLANRAARVLAGRDAGRLGDLDAVGAEAAAQLRELAHGSHRVLRFANRQRVLASAAQFDVPGEPSAKLLSLQRVAAELGAVELAAWDDMTRVLAHEMMNSLTPIASLSESLESQLRGSHAPGEAAESLEAIRRRSRGLDGIRRTISKAGGAAAAAAGAVAPHGSHGRPRASDERIVPRARRRLPQPRLARHARGECRPSAPRAGATEPVAQRARCRRRCGAAADRSGLPTGRRACRDLGDGQRQRTRHRRPRSHLRPFTRRRRAARASV